VIGQIKDHENKPLFYLKHKKLLGRLVANLSDDRNRKPLDPGLAEDLRQGKRGSTHKVLDEILKVKRLKSIFHRRSLYAVAGVLSEVTLAKKINDVVASDSVQELARQAGFAGMLFCEPIVAGTDQKFRSKFLIYRHIDNTEKPKPTPDLLRKLQLLFFNNGIVASDLAEDQFMLSKQDGKSYLVLADVEAYTKKDEPKEGKK
jgi:hypothetical protein